MKHVLLIGNLDGHSIPLLRYAGNLCKDLNLKLHILQINPDTHPIILSSPYYFNKYGFLMNQGGSEMKSEIESFVTSHIGNTIDTDWISFKIIKGEVKDSVETFISEEKIDLLIVRKSVFSNVDIKENEVFSKMFTNVSKVPMLVLPENQLYEPLKSVTYFTTFSDDDYSNIEWISKNFKNMQIKLIHFSNKEESVEAQKWIKFIKSEISNSTISYKRIDDTLENFVQQETNTKLKLDSIALKTHNRSFWQRIMDPSTTLNLIAKIQVPTLIFKYKEE